MVANPQDATSNRVLGLFYCHMASYNFCKWKMIAIEHQVFSELNNMDSCFT
jgi:hypothetical protein